MDIFQIVPSLSPSIGGVADYSFILARQLRAAHGVNTRFVVCDPNWKPEDGRRTTDDGLLTSDIRHPTSNFWLDGFPVFQLKERSAAELLRVLSQPGMPTTVLLQYVGYGYEKRGCPVWLARALRAWKSRKQPGEIGGLMECGTVSTGQAISQAKEVGGQKPNPISDVSVSAFSFSAERRLVTMFHELYAFGPPWRSSFWTSPVQRWIAKRLADVSDCCYTSKIMYAKMLRQLSFCHRQIRVFPIFSTIGESKNILPLQQRKRQMLIFGTPGWRRKIYTEHIEALSRACRSLRVERIVDVGESHGIKLNFMPVIETGRQPASEVRRLLSESMAGFMTYFDDSLAKSSIFAAYCAHGVLPILACRGASEADGITQGGEYLSALDMPETTNDTEMQAVADNAQLWYRKHSIEKTALKVAMDLTGEKYYASEVTT